VSSEVVCVCCFVLLSQLGGTGNRYCKEPSSYEGFLVGGMSCVCVMVGGGGGGIMSSFLRIHVGVCKGVHVIGDTRETNLVARVQLSLHTSVSSRTCEPTRLSRRMYDDLLTHTHRRTFTLWNFTRQNTTHSNSTSSTHAQI